MDLTLYFPDKDVLLDKIFKHPQMKPKKKPTHETALKFAVSTIEKHLVAAVADEVGPKLKEVVETMELMQGSFADTPEPEQDDYTSALDDKVEALMEPYLDFLSANWLGVNTIDTRIYEDGEPDKLATKVGKEVAKEFFASVDKSGAKILSRAGLVEADLTQRLEAQQTQTPAQEEQTLTEEQTDLDAVIERIATRIGKSFDIMTTYSELELASDDDEILASGAAARIGATPEDIPHLQLVAMTEADPAQFLIDKLNAYFADAKPAKKKRAKRTSADGTPPEGAVGEGVLKAIKEHSAIKDTELSEKLGISRTTFNHMVNGKSPFAPDDDQRAVVHTLLVTDINALLTAYGELNGVEVGLLDATPPASE